MKEFILTETSSERAVLVGLITPKVTERQVQDYLDELAFLSTTAGISPVKSFVQLIIYLISSFLHIHQNRPRHKIGTQHTIFTHKGSFFLEKKAFLLL